MYLYPLIDWNKTIVSPSYVRSSELTVHGNVFGSSDSKNWCPSYILAHWIGNDGNISNHAELGLNPRTGVIKIFIKHVLVHWFAYCEWFKPVQKDIKSKYGKPVEVSEQELYEQAGSSSFIPVSHTISKCVFVKRKMGCKVVIVIIPGNCYSCL